MSETIPEISNTDENLPEDFECSDENIKENIPVSSSEEDDNEEEENTENDNVCVGKRNIISLQNNTNNFIVSVDGVPQFYTRTLESARNYMWQFARFRKARINSIYNSYIREQDDPNSIQIVGAYRNSVLSCDRVLYRMEIHEISEISETEVSKPLSCENVNVCDCDKENVEIPEATASWLLSMM